MRNLRSVWGVAGGGKTTWLTKVLTGQQKFLDWKPTVDNTLCISFTRSARRVLKERLGEGWDIYTFHSYLSSKLVRKAKNLRFLRQDDIKRWFEERGFPFAKGIQLFDNDFQIVDMNHPYTHINRARNLLITMEEYVAKGLLDDGELNEDDFFKVAYEYLNFLKDSNSYDYTRILEDGAEADIELDKEYIFVDEAQDLTPLMFKVIEKALEKGSKVLLLGDPNQSIFGFAGSEDAILGSVSPEFTLSQSNRCYSEIVNYAKNFMEYTMPFHPKTKGGIVVEEELISVDYILEEVISRVRNDTAKSIFILTFTVKGALKVAEELKRNRIPYKLFSESPYPKDYVRVWRLYNLPFEELQIDDFLAFEKSPSKVKNFLKTFTKVSYLPASNIKELREIHKKLLTRPPETVFTKLEKDKLEEVMECYSPNARINVSTIHRIKGDEAQSVYVLFDAPKTLSEKYTNHLLYTASTRAVNSLVVYTK